ncbi:MAG TPA: tRNA (adenosine(37)-N6)-threonylcarbamoyltransferase complex ATPase subunit type 1 TsaE [Candidatus Eisenbacteria bacterium]|nr:tRNA (adenosine(37)-N6)-threonylcarbamoyltransferase complex ATPase subunit type 1 TsaE [Candidatus Eisenbacteria bacterium]
MPVEIRSLLRGEGETRAYGRHLGTLLRPGDCVALTGELGAGKTTLVQGVLESVHPGARVRSPTYVLVEVYEGASRVVHADLYRLRSEAEVPGLALEDLAQPDGILIVEWADRAGSELPPDRLELELRYVEEGGRELRARGRGARWEALLMEGQLDRDRWQHALHPGN